MSEVRRKKSAKRVARARRASKPDPRSAKVSKIITPRGYAPPPARNLDEAWVDATAIARLGAKHIPSSKVEYKIAIAVGNRGGRLVPLRIFRWKGKAHSVRTSVLDILEKVLSVPGMTGFLVAHSHPSGNLTPSEADFRANLRIARAAKQYDVRLAGNMIVAVGRRSETIADVPRILTNFRKSERAPARANIERENPRTRVGARTAPSPYAHVGARTAPNPTTWGAFLESRVVGNMVVPTGRGYVVRVVGRGVYRYAEPLMTSVSRAQVAALVRAWNGQVRAR